MKKISVTKFYYVLFVIGILSLTTVGSTYAYFAAVANSSNNVINTSSVKYSVGMEITPVYHGFNMIPLDYEDTIKGINNKCRDKYGRGACSLYKIKVFGFSQELGVISGKIKANSDINNLSFAILAPKLGTEDSSSCSTISLENEEAKDYCYYQEHTLFTLNEEQSMFSSYSVSGVDSVDFLLVVWLENEERDQNYDGIGEFSASVTIQSGANGVIEGYINDAIKIDNSGENQDNNG